MDPAGSGRWEATDGVAEAGVRRDPSPSRKTWLRAARVGGIYLVVSVLWITLSDTLVFSLPLSASAQQAIQTAKGLIFVSLSAVLVTLLARRELRRAEAETRLHEELARSRGQYRTLFEASPLPMFVFDRESLRFLAVNDATVALYGWSRDELLELDITTIRPPEDVGLLREVLAEMPDEGFHQVGIVRHRARDGRTLEMDLTTHRIPFEGHDAELVVANEVTERLEAERRLHQAQRMETVGRLASGVAHDFNNLLTVMGGVAQVVQEEVGGADSPLGAMLEEILEAQDRGAALTRQLLTFSRQSPERPTDLDLAEGLTGLSRMLGRLVGEDIRVEVEVPPDEVVVSMPRIHFEQVVMNLAVNARDAMEGGGQLRIELRPDPGDPEGQVLLRVSDTGRGMPPQVRSRIFEPFFTTKGAGGTGLGLATVFGIVTGAGGTIEVDSEEGGGSTFTIRLPRMDASDPSHQAVREEAPPRVRHARETVLLVEDEPILRRVLSEGLERLGYHVHTAAGAPEARRILREGERAVDVVVTDVVLPGPSGAELARQVEAERPDLPLVIVTGYTGNRPEVAALLESYPVLRKPFTIPALAEAIRRALHQGGSGQLPARPAPDVGT